MMKGTWLHRAFHGQGPLRTRVEGLVYVLISLSVLYLAMEMYLGRSHALVQALAQVDQYLLIIFALEIITRILSFHPPELDFYRSTGPRTLT